MDKLRSLGLAAALGLASVAYAQAQTPPADTQTTPQTSPSPDPNAASSPHQRDVTSQPGTETAPSQSPEADAASSPHQHGAVGDTPNAGMAGAAPKIVGLEVESPGGEPLGAVIDVVLDPATGEPGYVVISTGADTATAVPYSTVSPMVRNNKVVMDRSRLQNSPQVAQSDVRDKSNTKWRKQADSYWGSQQGSMRSASPGTDSNQQKPKDR